MSRFLKKGAMLALMLALCAYSYGEDSQDISALRKQVEELTQTVQTLKQTVNAQQQLLEDNGISSSTAENSANLQTMRQDLDEVLTASRQIKPNAFNPSISAAIDTVGSYSEHADNVNAIIRGAEIMLQSNVDQYAHAYAVINAHTELEPVEKSNPWEHTHLGLEEAAIETTSLPYGLQVKGGQFFTDFTRLAKVHPHDRPFVDGPPSVDAIIGGEAKGRGLELNWVPPMDYYLRWTVGAVDNIGTETSQNTQVTLLDGSSADAFTGEDHRSWSDVMYYSRLATIFELAQDLNLHVGVDYARTFETSRRQIASGDLKLEWKPDPTKHDLLTWGNEVLWSHQQGELTADAIVAGFPTTDGTDAIGGYTYFQYRFGKYWEPGIRFDLTRTEHLLQQDLSGGGVADTLVKQADYKRNYTAYVGFNPSEFQRLRLQLSYINATEDFIPGGGHDDWQAFLQWTIFFGDHKHPFMP